MEDQDFFYDSIIDEEQDSRPFPDWMYSSMEVFV